MSNRKRIEDILKEEKIYVSTTVGVSMYPMLRNRRDTIIVEPYEGRLKKYDVPLYKRNSDYVLHRIIEVREDSYVIRGDNCMEKEYGITDEQILGVLTGFYRGAKKVDMNGMGYKFYARFWHVLFPIRKLFIHMKWKAGKVYRFLRKGVKANEKEK